MKKIISLTVAIIVAFSFLAFPIIVSADDDDKMTTQEYYSSQAYLFTQLKDKKIDYPTYSERSKAVTDKYISDNTIIDDIGEHLGNGAKYASDKIGALGQKIGDTIDKYGNAAYDYLSSLGAGLLDGYTVQNQVPSGNMPDMKGYGAVAEAISIKTPIHSGGSDDALYRQLEYCDYIVLSESGVYRLFTSDGKHLYEFYTYFDEHLHVSGIESSFVKIQSEYRTYKFYGDIRYEDGTSAPNDNTYEIISDYDFTQATDKKLEDLINDLLNEFELQMPDLSSIEGLLNAIYARLGTLDSDNDNELLASVNAAVLALVKSNGDNNKALLDELLKFREDLKNGTVGSDSSAHGHEISGTLYNVIPLDKNWLNKIFHDKENLKVQYEGKTYYLEDCGCLKLDDKFYTPNMNYDSYAISDYDFSNDDIIIDNSKYVDVDFKNYTALFASFSSSQKKKFNNIIDLVTKFVEQAVPYSAIKGALIPFETIIFNSAEPKDIIFTFSFHPNQSGIVHSFAILKTSFFLDPNVSKAISIVKTFSTIVIGYSWLKVMRKKAASMLG